MTNNLIAKPIMLRSLVGVTIVCVTGCTPLLPKVEQGDTQLPATQAFQRQQSVPSEPLALRDSVGKKATLMPGTGTFIRTNQVPPIVESTGDDGIALNFEQTDLREVVTAIFQTLGYTYVIDPAVSGTITINMPQDKPLKRADLLPMLERLLAMNGAAMIKEGAVYRIIPTASALSGNANLQVAGQSTQPAGFGTRIFPLQYISATEMAKILTPFAPQGSVIQADTSRNLLMLSGTAQELSGIQATIDTFDVNWIKGMSVGIFALDSMDAESAAKELGNVFGAESQTPIAGMMRFVPITKANSLMVITPQKAYLQEVEKWLDRIDGSTGERLYVYNVENGDASYLAQILGEIFGQGGGGGIQGAGVAPGLGTSSIGGDFGNDSGSSFGSSGGSGGGFSANGDFGERGVASASSVDFGQKDSIGMFGGRNVRIVADAENNSILIWASAKDYNKVIAALRRVDRSPRQVLIEATFAEVNLKGNLEYGLSWFFKNGVGSDNLTGGGGLGTVGKIEGGIPKISANEFVYGVADKAGVIRGMLSALASDSLLNILSSPQILVVDNQEATIKVGGQVSVKTGSITNSGTTTGNTDSFTYRDTGVVLHVKPRVNSGGQVTLDIEQEILNVNTVEKTVSAGGNPDFLQRSIKSRISVQDGSTVVLGGLISEDEQGSKGGIPILYRLPVVGSLFGSTAREAKRTELMILITPRVINDGQEAQQATLELQQRMNSLQPILRKSR